MTGASIDETRQRRRGDSRSKSRTRPGSARPSHSKRLAKGFTTENIKPILAKERGWARSLSKADFWNIDHGKLPRNPHPDLPQIFTDPEHSVVTEIDGGASSVLPADVPAGSSALICRITDFRAQELYVASQIEVTGTASELD